MIPQQLKKGGFRFIKVRDNKAALEKDWQNTANYDQEDVDFPIYGVACGYGNLIVIDFDDKETQEKYELKLPSTFTVRTAGKGLHHLYFKTDTPLTKRLNGENGLRLADIQGKGTYVIGAGSTINGKKYEIVNDEEIKFIPYSKINEVFLDIWQHHETQTKTAVKDMGGVAKGQRDEVAFRKFCSLLKKGFSKEDVWDIVSTWNQRNDPPLSKFELEKCLNSALRYDYPKTEAPKQPGGKQNGFRLLIDNYYENAKSFWDVEPYFFNDVNIYWLWDKEEARWKQVDEVDIMNSFDKLLGFCGQTVNNKINSHTIRAIQRYGRDKMPKEAPVKWIQFKNKAYSITSHKVYDVTPDYFFTNPIPWELGKSTETPVMDKLFEEWVGPEYKQDLYEILAYCCYRSYPIQSLFCLYGSGRNGKSCFLRIMDKFLGVDNSCSTDLDLIAGNNRSRFESYKLYRKLVAMLGETNFDLIENPSTLKKLTGGDKIGFEKKGKDGFDDYSYAKILIASNSLPTTTDDTPGFYRRWHIISFPNEFPEGNDILETIPEEEYNNLGLKCMQILPELLKKGVFSHQGTIEERKEKYIKVSNPLSLFIRDCCDTGDELYVKSAELYNAYLTYLKHHKVRKVKKREFFSKLLEEGFISDRINKTVNGEYIRTSWVESLNLKNNWKLAIYGCENQNKKIVNFGTITTTSHINSLVGGVNRESNGKTAKIDKNTFSDVTDNNPIGNEGDGLILPMENPEIIHLPCHMCGAGKSNYFDEKAQGKPICEFCQKAKEAQ